MLRKIHLDFYLKNFVDFCRQRYDKNLIAIGIYGSYAWGYFDKEKSDYDVFLIFNSKIKNETEFLSKKFPRISINYFCDLDELSELIFDGHWTLYITLLKSARMLFYFDKYKIFLKRLKKIDFVKNLKNFDRIKWKAKFDREQIQKGNGYSWAKYAMPALRSRLQLLTYIRHRKLIWNLNKIIKLNKNLLTLEEREFLIQLNKSVRERKDDDYNKERAIKILDKVSKEILSFSSTF